MARKTTARPRRQKNPKPETQQTPEQPKTRTVVMRSLVPKWFALKEFQQDLSSLVSFAVHPYSEPISNGSMESARVLIRETLRTALAAFSDDHEMTATLCRAESAALEFAATMCNRPKLSTVPREEWTVPKYCRMFDELDAIASELKEKAEELERANLVFRTETQRETSSIVVEESKQTGTSAGHRGNNSWSPEAEKEGRRILKENREMGSNDFVGKIGGNRQVAQDLYRSITGKEKRRTRND